MIGDKTVACVIPARLKSSRFPKKILAKLGGKPLVQWTWEAAKKVSLFDSVTIAVDAEETASVIESFGGSYEMTSIDCLTGTDRLVELQQKRKVEADIWVNWQVDEPFLSSRMLADLLQSSAGDDAEVWTLKKRIFSEEQISSPHIPKIVCDEMGYALYFSRLPIPYYRESMPEDLKIYYKHIGIYAFSNDGLRKISTFSPSYLELAEHLEQLRFLSNGLRIKVHETKEEAFGIDLPEHLAKAEEIVSHRHLV